VCLDLVDGNRLRQSAGSAPRVRVRAVRRSDDDGGLEIRDLRQESQRAFGASSRYDSRWIVYTERCSGERFEAREIRRLGQSIA
jgi:hypothetical protein